MRYLLTGIFSAMAFPAVASSPIAEILCQPTRALEEKLSRQYELTRHARGVRGPDQMMEVWTDRTGDWTLVVTYASGTSCIVAMGIQWEGLQADDPA